VHFIYFRYLVARILQPEIVFFRIRPFAGWEITLEDFQKLSQSDQGQLLAKYEALSADEKSILELKKADRTLMEESEFADPKDMVYMVRKTLVPSVQTITKRGGVCEELIL
jgi:hypothetical protein